MGALEIFLIIFGIVLVVISFVFGEHLSSIDNKNLEYDGNVAKVTKEIVKKEVEAEVANVIDEKIEQAEVKLDKITNEKIMALGDYSDDVNVKITKNHDEVMFWYDMLSDKEKTIKNTVKDIEALKTSVKNLSGNIKSENSYTETTNENNDSLDNHLNNSKSGINEILNVKEKKNYTNDKSHDNEKNISEDIKELELNKEKIKEKNNSSDVKESDNKQKLSNDNMEILRLHKEGKSAVEIAQKLERGVGEVQLVIGLYKDR